MSKSNVWKLAVLVSLVAACGGTENGVNEDAALLRSEGTLHDFCPGEEIPVWAGVGNQASAIRVGTLVLGSGTATLTVPGQLALAPTVLHLQFADALAGIPVTSSGNPIPGQFACQFPVTPVHGQTVFTFDLADCPIADTNGDGTVLAAAHFGFEVPGGLGSMTDFYLPLTPVTIDASAPVNDGAAYIPSVIVSGAGALDGSYVGWCADPNRSLGSLEPRPMMLYSTYDAAAMANVASLMYPPTTLDVSKLPIVNYIVNNYAVGRLVTPVDETCAPIEGAAPFPIIYRNIQRAIWQVAYGHVIVDGSLGVVQAIVCEATANGSAFAPACGQSLLILAVPMTSYGTIANQAIFIPVPIPCGSSADETAWADGYDGRIFPGARQWGTYFEYDLACGP